MGNNTPFLSIIIPAYNEAGRLPATLERVVGYVNSLPFESEVIVVDNASDDDTNAVVTDFAARSPVVRSLHESRRGKGAAVRTGIMGAAGEYLVICDADLAVPIDEIEHFLPPRPIGYDIAIGSREAKGAKRYGEPFHRHLMGRVFNIVVRILLLPGLQDTQCGFKCFRRDAARDLFSSSEIDGWSFDVEILSLARQKGYGIVEVPVSWYYGKESKVHPVRDTFGMLREILKIRKMVAARKSGLAAAPGLKIERGVEGGAYTKKN